MVVNQPIMLAIRQHNQATGDKDAVHLENSHCRRKDRMTANNRAKIKHPV